LNPARPLALAAVLLPGAALASAPGMYGFGSRSSAMAGAVSADVADFSASYYNPAGLVRAPSLRLDLGYFWAAHALRANDRDSGVDPAHGLVGGIVAPGEVFRLPFAFGLGLHLPDDRLSRSRSLPQSQPRWELYDNRVQLLYIAANLAVAPRPWLRLGGGLAFVSSTRGRLDIYGDIAFPSAGDSRLRHSVDADLRAVRYPQFGVQVDVRHDLTLSMVYRGEFSLRLEIDARVSGDIVLGSPASPGATRIPGSYMLSSSSVAVFLPQQAVLGAAWRPREDLTLVADVTWIDWSAYRNPTAQLRTRLDVQIPPGLGNFMVPATPPAQQALEADFRDTLVPRVGFEWRAPVAAHTLALRGGYRYDPSPVPDQTGATNFMDANRHVLSAGAGLTVRGLRPVLGGALVFDVHADLQLLERRVVLKENPADPVGDYVLGGQVFNLGATLATTF
jgi:long-chain fatty acid transport protein